MWIRRASIATLFLGLISAGSWAQTVPASGNTCIATYNGIFNHDVTISAGQTCTFTSGGVTGNVTVNSGGSLVLVNATVSGNVQVNGGTFSIGPSTTIKGNLQIQNILAGSAPSQVCGSQVNGNLVLQNTGSSVQVGSVSGSCWGNSIVHDVQIQNNTGSIQVVGNAVGGNLQCQSNSSLLEGPNAAPNQQGQCRAASSYPAIVEIAAGADIKAIASALQAQIINQMPQSGTYLLSVHSLSPTAYLTPGVLLIEINLSNSLGGPKGGILQTSNTTGPNW